MQSSFTLEIKGLSDANHNPLVSDTANWLTISLAQQCHIIHMVIKVRKLSLALHLTYPPLFFLSLPLELFAKFGLPGLFGMLELEFGQCAIYLAVYGI